MKKLNALYLATLIALNSCVAFQSNTRINKIPQFTNVLVVANTLDTSYNYTSQFMTAFPRQYTICTIAHSLISFNSLENEIQKRSKECGSEVILELKQITDNSARFPEYYLEMRTLSTNEPFWKAHVDVQGAYTVSAAQIVKQLKKDKIINEK